MQILVLIFSFSLWAKVDKFHLESYLGEKNLPIYTDRYGPFIFQDPYQGKLSFQDEIFFQNFFDPFLFRESQDFSFFLKSELNGGISCSNELLSKHFDDIRYSYRLITLSYLLEGQWHLKLLSDHLRVKDGCQFDLQSWLKTCQPKGAEMKKFVSRLGHYNPKYHETLSSRYSRSDWWKEFSSGSFKWYSHYRMKSFCKNGCKEEELPKNLNAICAQDMKLMTLICSENDEIYGLASNRDAYQLLGQSNIINTFNKSGEAMGCLRRFSEVMSHKEVQYEVLNHLFPSLQTFLREKYNERFLQGRVFFYGSGKEFEVKGLSDLYVKEQPLKIDRVPDEPIIVAAPEPKKVEKKPEPEVVVVKTEAPKPAPVVKKEIHGPMKSAFLLAAEIRDSQDLERVEVDMLKLKYDYVFSLNMINTLSTRLKTFMTRDALAEMMAYDKLGTKEGPVPLLFLKFMVDMQEHQGLWNLVSVLGDRFWVSNEIDASFKPHPEYIQIMNNASTGNQWQIFVLRP